MEEVHVYPVFICDDEPRQITIIDQILGKAEDILANNNEIRFRTSFATNFEDAVKYFDQNKDEGGIYFLDIELGTDKNQNNGFDLAEIIKKQDDRAQIIFITTHDDMSLITFQRRLGPVDYIVKPRSESEVRDFQVRLVKTIDISLDHLRKFNYMKKMTFSYRIGRLVQNINVDDIIYITTTSTPHKLLLVELNGQAQFLGTISKYANSNAMLVQISQSCLVNPKNIKAIDLKNCRVQFVNGNVAYFSQTHVGKMKKMLDHYNYDVVEGLVNNI